MAMHKVLKYILTMVVLAGFASCSIYDHYSGISQTNVVPRLVNNDSIVLPDSLVNGYKLYFFMDERYAEMQPEYQNGQYVIVFPSDTKVSFVAVALKDSTQYTLNEPKVGESIDNIWLTAHTASENEPPYPQGIYFGRIDVMEAEGDRHLQYTLDIAPYDSQLHIYLSNARNKFGLGEYECVVQGLRNGVSYGGRNAGDYVIYSFTGSFKDNGDWVSTPLHVFPSNPGDVLRVMLYKDKYLVFETTVDQDGNPLAIPRGSDICFYYNLPIIGEITIQVLPWKQVENNFIVY